MNEYICKYLKIEGNSNTQTIYALNEEQAYQKYLEIVGVEPYTVVISEKGIIVDGEEYHFSNHCEKLSYYNDTNREIYAQNAIKYLHTRKQDGYLMLESDEKIEYQKLFNNIIQCAVWGPLLREEVDYLDLWRNFKDRDFGQSLIYEMETDQADDSDSLSELASTMYMGIMGSNLASHAKLRELREMNETIDEIAEDVEDVNEGSGFDE